MQNNQKQTKLKNKELQLKLKTQKQQTKTKDAKQQEKNKTKCKQTGITMVALVITIIILLILAGVTIATLSGDNGILSNATKAKLETEIAQDKEQLSLYYVDESMNDRDGSVGIDDYLNYIEDKGIPTKEEDGKYYAEVDGKIYELGIENDNLTIDYVGEGKITEPRITKIEIVNKTLSSIEIKVEALRMEEGTYYYYIGTSENTLAQKGSNKTAQFTFNNLEQGKTYYIKVIGESKEGKKAEKTITAKIDSIPDATTGNMNYTIKWENGTATVTVTTTSKYTIQTSTDNKTYKSVSTVTGLNSGDIVYARLTNGEYYGKEIEIPVIDKTKPELTITKGKVTTKSIEITAKATDTESGITSSKPYKIYISKTVDEYTGTPVTTETGNYTFENLDQNTTYYIKVEIEDRAGNVQTKTTTIKTELIPRAEEAIARDVKWNSNGTAQITLSTQTEFSILYSNDRNNWTPYEGNLTANNGETVYICLTDEVNKGEDYGIVIRDNEGPIIDIERQNITSNSITVNVKAQDTGAGMPQEVVYNYYIKESNEEEYRLVGPGVADVTYTYGALKAQTTYNIKVTTTDLIGNQGEGTTDATTQEFVYVKGNIEFGNINWANKQASVGVTNNTEYQMEYKVILKGEEIELEGGWQKAENKTETVGNLKDGDLIIARLTDGINTTAYASLPIEDNVLPTIEVEGQSEEWTNKDVILTVIAQDNESGLQENAYSFDGGNTWQADNTKTYNQNTAGIVIKVRDEAGNEATYQTINISNIDKEGPILDVETDATSNTITIDIKTVNDTGVGMEESPIFTYYKSEDSLSLETMQGEESKEKTKTYTNLKQNTTYYIKIETEDKLGNKTKVYKTISTGSLDASSKDLQISDPSWSEKKASVTITNSSTYKMQYQVVKKGETFDTNTNWTTTEEKEKEIPNLLSGDTVYARLTDGNNVSGTIIKEIRDIKAPEIQQVEGQSQEWTNQDVTLTVTAQDNESGLQENAYSFDGGKTWQAENTKTYNQNTAGIVIKVRDEAGNEATYQTIDITNIDKTGPEILIQEGEITTKEITVNVTANDKEVGIEDPITYTYYIKEEAEQEFTKEAEIAQDTYKYEDLKANTKYIIKVEAKDKLQNIGEKTIEITTRNLLYAVGNIEFTKTIWSNGIATVQIKNNIEEYDMQYQIGKNGAKINLNGSWTTIKDKTKEIGGLEDEDIIYARLTDGINVTTGYANCEIDNPAKETYTEEELAKETQRQSYDVLGISVKNNEIRVQIEEEQENAVLYNYYYKTINDSEYKLISTNTYYNDPAVIREVEEGAVYKIKALTMDEEGNVTRSENTVTTIALGQAEENQTYPENRTYIDNSKQIDVRVTAGTGTAGTGETTKTNAGYTVSVPASFKVSEKKGENKQEEGIVLKDGSNNEYVWIPVNDAIYDGITDMPENSGTASRTYKPMAIAQNKQKSYYEGLIYTFDAAGYSYRNSSNTGIGKTGSREPSLVTDNANDGYTWSIETPQGVRYDASEENYKTILGYENASEFGKDLATSYNNMITAVDSYGGFYVGRYETTMEESNNAIIVGSKPNAKILSTNNWYKMNLYQNSERYEQNPYKNTASVTSSMIWGSQWDAMLNYILTGKDKGKVATKIGTQKNQISNSAQDETDKINNIYDLGSNVYEWTQEASSANYRVYRGGSYDTSVTGTPSSRKTVIPTDQGPVFGTRMGLYVKSTNDVIGPSIKIDNITSTSNTITIEVTATDKETGVEKYKYYKSQNGSTWELVAENNTNRYTYTGLLQDTNYYLKVEVQDGAGNIEAEGENFEIQAKTEKLGNVASTAITRIQKYGPNMGGIIQLQLEESYKNSGYHIEYQVVEMEQNVDMQGEWIEGEIINNLQNGQKIYATIYDGLNRSSDYYQEEVTGLEEYAYIDSTGKTYTEEQAKQLPNQTTYDTTIEYTDVAGQKATIPAGFKVGITETVKNINEGLVIQDNKGNQFVWVPVEKAIETNTDKNSTEKAMARIQKGYTENEGKVYYEGILYDFSGIKSTKKSATTVLGTTAHREPTLVTGGADYTWNISKNNLKGTSYDSLEQYYKNMNFGTTSGVNAFNSYTEFGQYMNEEFTNMINSVEKYKGFYVGRYETSIEGTQNKDSVVQTQIGKTPINNKSWYQDYYWQDSNINSKNPYYGLTSITSSMIWGSQWDAVMNWMLQDDKTKEYITEITGNHTEKVSTTGAYTNDLAKNIFDLSANVTEWTQQGENNYRRWTRGGTAGNTGTMRGQYTASTRLDYWSPPTSTQAPYKRNESNIDTNGNFLGTRMALYIKNTQDTTAPSIEVTNKVAGTNNIEVTVNAIDNESGISKYRYSISYKNFEETGFTEEDVLKTIETYGNTYTFEELTQNTTYYIKIEAINGIGKTATAYTGKIMTDILEIKEGTIVKEKVYGKNGEGTAYFIISDTTDLESQGYYLQYQIGKQGAGYQENGIWQTGDTVTGLSVGDVIYTRLYDGINKTEYFMTTNITELETFSEVYQQTTKYEDYDILSYEEGEEEKVLVGTAYIPKGFKVATSSMTKKIANGLVIEDEQGNQFVWIPVENVVYDGKTSISSTYKPMAKYQSGYTTNSAQQYFESIVYSYSGTTSSASPSNRLGTSTNREPSLVTNSTANYSWIFTAGNNYDATNYNQLNDIGITSAVEMGQYMNNKYTEMIESVKEYGGYYVGRYETSLYTESGQNSKNGIIVKSVAKQTPMAEVNWYKMYLTQDSNYEKNPYNKNTDVKTSMIWGSQWDTMLNYILQGTDKEKVTKITGNHTGTRAVTGKFGSDIMNNIFDLSSNVREWTQEAYSSVYRVLRGSYCVTTETYTSTYRNNSAPTNSYYSVGSRLSLYLSSSES